MALNIPPQSKIKYYAYLFMMASLLILVAMSIACWVKALQPLKEPDCSIYTHKEYQSGFAPNICYGGKR